MEQTWEDQGQMSSRSLDNLDNFSTSSISRFFNIQFSYWGNEKNHLCPIVILIFTNHWVDFIRILREIWHFILKKAFFSKHMAKLWMNSKYWELQRRQLKNVNIMLNGELGYILTYLLNKCHVCLCGMREAKYYKGHGMWVHDMFISYTSRRCLYWNQLFRPSPAFAR